MMDGNLPLQRLTEDEVGILEFLQPCIGGFEGRVKERWQDFHVHEVDQAGVELKLAELLTPGAVAAELRHASAERREARAALGPSFAPDEHVKAELDTVLGPSFASDLIEFLRCQKPKGIGSEQTSADPKVELPEQAVSAPPAFLDIDAARVGDGSKEARKNAHQTVLKVFGSFLNTETVESEGGVRHIRIWMREAELQAKTSGTKKSGDGDQGCGGNGKGKGKGKSKSKGKRAGKDKGKGKRKGQEGDVAETNDTTAASVSEFGTLRREGWPKDRPDYLYFRLYKENCSTSEAVSNIARCVGRSPKQFTFAGTKDRRAITVQQICAHRLPADQLRRTVLHRSWDRRCRISNLEYRGERLRLGMLRGNSFHIALRGVARDALCSPGDGSSTAKLAFTAVSERGFLNYYGLQRFGTQDVRTHTVGAAIVARRWEEAVRMILGETKADSHKRSATALAEDNSEPDMERKPKVQRTEPKETPEESQPSNTAVAPQLTQDRSSASLASRDGHRKSEIRAAQRLFLESGDAQGALQAMPRSQHLERCVLGALVRNLPPIEALRQLPHQALSLYAHAAQSLVWNAVLSHRIRVFGTQPVVGDLVFASIATGKSIDLDDNLDDVADAASDEDESKEDTSWQLPEVRELKTAEEAAAAELADVILPLPGSQVTYPTYLLSAFKDAASTYLGLSLADFHASDMVALSGSYRSIVVKPAGLDWHAVTAAEVCASTKSGTLIETDVQRLLAARTESNNEADVGVGEPTITRGTAAAGDGLDGTAAASAAAAAATTTATAKEHGVAAHVASGKEAVVFKCILPPSAYLTMLLRELTKQAAGSLQLQG
mmetsp:Transcript_133069/g.265513  ORF Transcript_133069/g.265513 Transcript_133069/m.265513 type:complete len:835 (-) Transcript_133069:445-2949(-)